MLFFRNWGMECSDLFLFFVLSGWISQVKLCFHRVAAHFRSALRISHSLSPWFMPSSPDLSWHRNQAFLGNIAVILFLVLRFASSVLYTHLSIYFAANGVWDDLVSVLLSGPLSRGIWTAQSITVRLNLILFFVSNTTTSCCFGAWSRHLGFQTFPLCLWFVLQDT